MPPSIPTALYPVFESSFLCGVESAAGTEASAFTGIPTAPLSINPNYNPLRDTNLRGSNVETYDMQFGSRHAEITIPESPCYGDTIGHPLRGCLGDYYSSGTASTPVWTTSGALSPGAGPIAVTSGSAAAAGTYIQIDTSTNSEVVKVGTGSTTTSIVVDASTPIRFSHLSGVSVVTVVSSFTHNFSNLNMASSTGSTTAQPPSYTVLHRNGIAPTFSADRYLYGHFDTLKFQAKKDGWFVWDGKVTSFTRSAPSASFPPSFSSVTGLPSWRSTVSVAGTQQFNVTDLTVNLSRKMDIVPTADGSQDPYVIGMGPLTAMFDIDFDVAGNETVLTYLENNTKPTFSWTISNGLSGANTVSFAIAGQLAGFEKAPLSVMQQFWGFKASGELLANTTNAGNSGGYSPLAITLINSVATY
jgi:hypothetical protein